MTYVGQVLAVFGAKAGVGCTTTAANLARALAMVHGQARVLMCDMSLAGSPLGGLYGTRALAFLSDLAANQNASPEEMRSLLVEVADGVWLVNFAPPNDHAATATAAAALGLTRNYFDFTVLDCRHQLDTHTVNVLDAADRLLLLTEQKVPALRATQRTLNIFRRLGYSAEKICLLLNRYEADSTLTMTEAADVLKGDIFHKLPRDDSAIVQAARQRALLVEVLPQPALAREFIELARKLPGPAQRPESHQYFMRVFPRKDYSTSP